MPKSMRNKLLDRIQLFSAAVLMAVFLCAFLSDRRQAESNERPWQVRAYIDNYLYLAREIEQYNGIPVPLTLAVAGLESQWGRSELARNANNHFGLKIKPGWKGHEYCKTTQEYQDSHRQSTFGHASANTPSFVVVIRILPTF